jgi:hypothetical protein
MLPVPYFFVKTSFVPRSRAIRLIQHGIDPPFINAPLSPSMLFQRKKKGKKNKYDGILTLKDSKDKKKAKSCSLRLSPSLHPSRWPCF